MRSCLPARYLAEIAGERAARTRDHAAPREARAARTACTGAPRASAIRCCRPGSTATPIRRSRTRPTPLAHDCARPTTTRSMRSAPKRSSCLRQWPTVSKSATDDEYRYVVRGREIRGENYTETLSRNRVPKLAVPSWRDWGEQLTFLLRENLPGHFPYTAGVYPYRREEEDLTRMFAGEGGRSETNRRFHYVASGHGVARLSTAFDSTTLYGEDPDREARTSTADIGNSGVVDRDTRRHEETLFGLRPVRPDDLGVDDDQRPGADDPGDVHEHRDRPAASSGTCVPAAAGRRRSGASRRSTATANDPATRASCHRTTTVPGWGSLA